MTFALPSLPYAEDALSPVISPETMRLHYGKHHAGYVDKLNALTEGTELAGMSLEDVIQATQEGPIFNNAAQVWNHTFYWHCMTPDSDTAPSADLKQQLAESFGSVDELRHAFIDAATGNFGSGWTWLVRSSDGTLRVVSTSNADTPLIRGDDPLLVCDVWEHAYYIDYRNARPDYLKAWWDIVNWQFVSEQYANAGRATSAAA